MSLTKHSTWDVASVMQYIGKYRSIALCLIIFLLSPINLAAELSPREIVNRHIQAIGGSELVNSIKNLRVRVLIEEPEFLLRGDYRATSDGLMRIDVYDGTERVFSEGIDSAGGWQQNGEGSPIESLSPEGLTALERGIEYNLLGLSAVESRGNQSALLGRLEHSGVNYYRLQVIAQDGFERHYLINPETWFIDFTREASALHPDVDPTIESVESFYSNYQEVCGLMKNNRTQTIKLGNRTVIQQTLVQSTQCNLPIDGLSISRPLPD